jgi:hypothetical protein
VTLDDAAFFGFPKDYKCTKVVLTRNGLSVAAAPHSRGVFWIFGMMDSPVSESRRAMITVELSPNQIVFSRFPKEQGITHSLSGEMGFYEADMMGEYVSADRKIRHPLLLQFRKGKTVESFSTGKDGWQQGFFGFN